MNFIGLMLLTLFVIECDSVLLLRRGQARFKGPTSKKAPCLHCNNPEVIPPPCCFEIFRLQPTRQSGAIHGGITDIQAPCGPCFTGNPEHIPYPQCCYNHRRFNIRPRQRRQWW